ncbi:MAG: hypothetical protein ABL953_06975 [Ilumatobacteraceae bacterium]
MAAMMLLADSFEDPERARTIYLAAGGLVLVALLVIAGTVWWWRSAAVEHPALGPLEVMGTKSWWKSDHSDRRDRLESVRPDGAEPGDTSLIVPDPVDLLDDDRTRPLDFDDLAGAFDSKDDWRSDDVPEVANVRDDREVREPWEAREPREVRPVRSRPNLPMDPLLGRQSDDY